MTKKGAEVILTAPVILTPWHRGHIISSHIVPLFTIMSKVS